MKLYLCPEFAGEDNADGGVRRVVEAQRRWLPEFGVELVDSPMLADLCAAHIFALPDVLDSDKPLVVHSHGLYWYGYEWPNWALKANTNCMESIRQADLVTAPSEWVAQALRRNSLRRVEVVGHGLDIEDWSPAENRGYVLWNKTRVDPICDPEPLNSLARLARDVGFVTTFGDDAPNLTVTGALPYEQAKELVRHAGVYLCTAKETFGIGTLEAMACGVPVLGWRWGGQADIVWHKETGWLAEPGDYEGLLEGLHYCLENRKRLGTRAREVVARSYKWRDVARRYVSLYESLLKRGAGPKVSVVVPAYSLAEFLPEALDSVLSQSYKDWECIVVDDASPDACGEIADDYAKRDSRFRVIHNEENQYLAGALNVGIAAANGQYILPLDADNVLPPATLSLLADALDSNRDIHIAYGSVEFLEEDGRRWHSGWPPEFRADRQLLYRAGDGRPANLMPSTSMYRRCVWELTGGYRGRYRTAEDADFWTRAVSYGFRPKQVTHADTLVYRNRLDSMSREESLKDWTAWMPWCRDEALPPAAVISDIQAPIPAFDAPRIAVVIPVGPAHRELVVDALDSVDAQTFRDWECIVVNDSGEPLRWVPSWAKVIETAENLGVAACRNMGISASAAPLFVPLDADDTLEPQALTKMLEIYERYGGYIYSDMLEVWQGEEPKVWQAPEYDARLLLSKGCLHAVTGLYRKADWETIGGYDEELPAWEDWDFQLKLANRGICGTRVPEPLFAYRKDTGSRREENYADFEGSKSGILERWEEYFQGRKELMGCRGCPGGGGGRVSQQIIPSQRAEPPPSGEGYVTVEYTGAKLGAFSMRGSNGQLYRFSADPRERIKYVLATDAGLFRDRTDFRILEPEGERVATS